MTHQELLKLYGLKGQLSGARCEAQGNIRIFDSLMRQADTPRTEVGYKFARATHVGMLHSIRRLERKVEQIIREAKNA